MGAIFRGCDILGEFVGEALGVASNVEVSDILSDL